MAFVVPPTFADIRRSVATRCKLGAKADASNSMREILSEGVRQAVAWLYLECDQAQQRVRIETDLITDQAQYDWPDEFDPGKLGTVSVLDTDGNEHVLTEGITVADRNQYPSSYTASMPVRYQIINENLELLPAPDADTYTTLRLEGFLRPVEPQHDDDPIPFDKESIIALATGFTKTILGKSDSADALRDAMTYVKRRASVDAEGSSFSIGANRVLNVTYLNRRLRRLSPIFRRFGG